MSSVETEIQPLSTSLPIGDKRLMLAAGCFSG